MKLLTNEENKLIQTQMIQELKQALDLEKSYANNWSLGKHEKIELLLHNNKDKTRKQLKKIIERSQVKILEAKQQALEQVHSFHLINENEQLNLHLFRTEYNLKNLLEETQNHRATQLITRKIIKKL